MTIKKLFRRIDENLEECFYFECSKSIDDETFTILNKLFKTTNRGNSWEKISEDLSQQIDRNKLVTMGAK